MLVVVGAVILFALVMRGPDKPTQSQRKAAEDLYRFEQQHPELPREQRFFGDGTRGKE